MNLFHLKADRMAVIHKRGSYLQAENYRGIMLLPSIAKRVHAMLRTRLMRLLATQHPQGQIGGFSSDASAIWISTSSNLWTCDGPR